ncbi:DUF1294 domain-containing protein [Enterococcus timonensis]|uniref:DUF1294 domain-containing protein n=1 Tax=Enterococcus timonensis TaxID=1852364 RepID=UPI0008DB2D0D|nr:DUF1294 domain-containing protein [Enterococcus timonensis]
MTLVTIGWGIFILENLVTFSLFGLDKYKAVHHRYRIPEKVLLWLAFFSGGVGSFLARHLFHHKTRKYYFTIVDVVGWIALVIVIFWLRK